jgi:hypothetical protein
VVGLGGFYKPDLWLGLFFFERNLVSYEALAKVVFVILSEAKDLDSSVACGSLRMTDIRYLQEAHTYKKTPGGKAMAPTDQSEISREAVWHPSYRAFFVYYVAIAVAVFGPLINPEVGVPPWVGFVLGLAVLAALALRKFGQEYRATPKGLKRVNFGQPRQKSLPGRKWGRSKCSAASPKRSSMSAMSLSTTPKAPSA